MTSRAIALLKVVIHVICLLPLVFLYRWYSGGQMAASDDPVKYATHFTGRWALWMLLASLALTPLRRMHRMLSYLIRFRRMIGLYAFFYATCHLGIFLFVASGYDVPGVLTQLRAGHPGAMVAEWKTVWPSILEDVQSKRFVKAGLVAWGLLLTLAVTSPLAVLRWMGGKNWQRLHRVVYVAAWVALTHAWWGLKKGDKPPVTETLLLMGLLLIRVAWVIWNRRRRVPMKTVSA